MNERLAEPGHCRGDSTGRSLEPLIEIAGDAHTFHDPRSPLARGNSILDRDLTTQMTVEADIVYVSWRARQDGQADLAGVDTFITDGLITSHTAFHVAVE